MQRLGDGLKAALDRIASSGAIDDEKARERTAYGEQMEREVAKAKRRDNLFRGQALHSVTPKIRDAIVNGTLAKPAKDTALDFVQRWNAKADAPACIALQGGTGTGKSVAATWLIAERGGVLRSAAQVVRAFGSRALDAVADQEVMLRCPLLVLDDLGTEHARDREWMILALRELLECRQASRMLWTTNNSKEQALSLYPDERIASRAERIAWLTVTGEDMRRAK